ncbi:hypothetical protein E8E14_003292 [Neopestalotiopsis sp. 37M]|nr:hypothetical protein E8E14_003292 [Neopestalotiopsis sp. 37M]
MAEAAGLALGILGIASLFTSCVENFDIVVRAKEFSKDFDLQCTLLSVQRFRLSAWGETLGLAGSSRLQRRYKRAIERQDVQSLLTSTLNQLQLLLSQADVVNGRYALQDEVNNKVDLDLVASSHGMTIFRESFERFRNRLKRNQKQKSVWMVTRWSVHDQPKFEMLVTNITKLIDGLEAITAHIGLLAQQRTKLEEEIASLSDTESLRLLQDVGSTKAAGAALRAASDTASVRLTLLNSSCGSSYFTAPTAQSHRSTSINAVARPRDILQAPNRLQASLQRASQIARKDTQQQGTDLTSYTDQVQRPSSSEFQQESDHIDGDKSDDIPQHQRWMAALIASQSDRHRQLTLASDEACYGTVLSRIRDEDYQICTPKLAGFMGKAGVGSSLAQRIFIELRNIRRAEIPFISAAPVGDALDKILASIEGPPGTPYTGGIFWITVLIRENEPPSLRFHTRIYHPNIDYVGRLCADYHSWWRESNLLNTKVLDQRGLPWFSRFVTNHFNLGALLVAVCGLLASPNIDDPLVPEIAEKYIVNYDDYYASAALYTAKYAQAGRPTEDDLVFTDQSLEEDSANAHPAAVVTRTLTSSLENNSDKRSINSNATSRKTLAESLISRYNLEGPPDETGDVVRVPYKKPPVRNLEDDLARQIPLRFRSDPKDDFERWLEERVMIDVEDYFESDCEEFPDFDWETDPEIEWLDEISTDWETDPEIEWLDEISID